MTFHQDDLVQDGCDPLQRAGVVRRGPSSWDVWAVMSMWIPPAPAEQREGQPVDTVDFPTPLPESTMILCLMRFPSDCIAILRFICAWLVPSSVVPEATGLLERGHRLGSGWTLGACHGRPSRGVFSIHAQPSGRVAHNSDSYHVMPWLCHAFVLRLVGNSCRSQMAAAIARSMGFEAQAQAHPTSTVAEHALTVLKPGNRRGLQPKG